MITEIIVQREDVLQKTLKLRLPCNKILVTIDGEYQTDYFVCDGCSGSVCQGAQHSAAHPAGHWHSHPSFLSLFPTTTHFFFPWGGERRGVQNCTPALYLEYLLVLSQCTSVHTWYLSTLHPEYLGLTAHVHAHRKAG